MEVAPETGWRAEAWGKLYNGLIRAMTKQSKDRVNPSRSLFPLELMYIPSFDSSASQILFFKL